MLNSLKFKLIAPILGTVGVVWGFVIVYVFINLIDYDNTESVRNLLIVAILGLALASFISIVVVSRVLKPLKSLASAANSIAEGKIAVNFEAAKDDEIGQTVRSFRQIADVLAILHKDFIAAKEAVQSGNPRFQIEDLRLKGVYADIVDAMNAVAGDFAFTCDSISEPMLITDNNMRVNFANKAMQKITKTEGQNFTGTHIDTFLHGNISSHPATIAAMNTIRPQLEIDVQLELSPGVLTDFEYNCVPHKLENGMIGAVVLMTNLTHIRSVQRHEEKVNAYRHDRDEIFNNVVLASLESGNLSLDFPPISYDDDTKEVAQEMITLESTVKQAVANIKDYVDEISDILQEIADNNFDVQISRNYVGDFRSIQDSIRLIVEHVSDAIHEIQTASSEVEGGANQIASSTQDLMANFQQQAAAIDEVHQAIGGLAKQTQRNASDAISANELSRQVEQAATAGSRQMADMSVAMKDIKQSSDEISKLVSIITEIAFQTNLLALNASVESARAGEHGRGFSVVAEAVRALAQRSDNAAKETAEMLEKSMERVQLGVSKSAETTKALVDIEEKIGQITSVIANIADASKEQASDIEKIQGSIETVNRGAAYSTDAVQANASVSEELSSQASVLRSLVGQFRIRAHS